MMKVKNIVIRILKCIVCILTGSCRNKGKGGGNAETC